MNAEQPTGQFMFIDTNVLVYAFDRSAGQKNKLAAQLVKQCWENENGCLSLQVLQEFYINVTRKIPRRLDHLTARQLVSDLAHWRIHIPEVEDMLQAIDIQQRYPLSFWDAMVIQSAVRLDCRRLISEDLNDGQLYGTVRVINPFKGDG